MPLPILLDLQGPRIRIGTLPRNGIRVREGQTVSLTVNEGEQPTTRGAGGKKTLNIPIGYPALTKDLTSGKRILIDDGQIELSVKNVTPKRVECSVIAGGPIISHKGVNFPDTSLSIPSLTDKDHEDIKFAAEHHVDYVALSFVRSSQDIRALKKILRQSGNTIPVIAKIERPEAIKHLSAILNEADGVMVARGDLAIEMTIEAVPILQKRIIAEANRRNRLVITATQMLESMTQHSMPTRAEASDVANAVLDGSDVLMLSAETSTGKYPLEAVRVMDRVIRSAETARHRQEPSPQIHKDARRSVTASVCIAAALAAKLTKAKLIVVFTESGSTALLLSKQRPSVRIAALTPSTDSVKRMAAFWGVNSYFMPYIPNADERLRTAETILKRNRLVRAGNRVVILSGAHGQETAGTNLMKIHEVS